MAIDFKKMSYRRTVMPEDIKKKDNLETYLKLAFNSKNKPIELYEMLESIQGVFPDKVNLTEYNELNTYDRFIDNVNIVGDAIDIIKEIIVDLREEVGNWKEDFEKQWKEKCKESD